MDVILSRHKVHSSILPKKIQTFTRWTSVKFNTDRVNANYIFNRRISAFYIAGWDILCGNSTWYQLCRIVSLMGCLFNRFEILQHRDRVRAYAFCTHARANVQCLVDCQHAPAMIRRCAINHQCFLTQLASLQNNASEMYDFARVDLYLSLFLLRSLSRETTGLP